MRITEKVGAWLQEEGHTKKKLADELGFSEKTLLNKLRQESEWSWSEVTKLAEVIGCDLKDLKD